MKRIFAWILMLVLVCPVFAMAEADEIEDMDFESLSALKQAIDTEYYSREEAEPQLIVPGFYTVGEDIKAGRYYIAYRESESDSYARLHIYETRQKYDERPSGQYGEYVYDEYIEASEGAMSVSLENGNYLYLQYATLVMSVAPLKEEDMYHYQAPEGTYVSVGAYFVGENGDIPVGNYIAFAATASGGDVKVYYSRDKYLEDGSWHFGYDQHYDVYADGGSIGFYLDEGYVLYVEEDVVMRKQAKLSFD